MPTEVTMSLADWQDKQARVAALEAELADTRRALDEARLGDGEADARRLATALCHALEIVTFAIASYEPRMYPGWPHEALSAFAKLLPDLPGVPTALREQANDLSIFCRSAAEWEAARADGTQELKLLEENAAAGLELPECALKGASSLIHKG